MPNKVLLSLATVALFAATAKADTTYTVDESVKWFDENIAGSSTAPTTDGSYSATPSVAGSENTYYIAIDTAANSPLFFTPSATISTLEGSTTYSFDVKFKSLTVNASTSSLPTTPAGFGHTNVPYAAIAAAVNEGNKWYGWDGDSWEHLSSISAPTEGNEYDVVIEFFVESNQLKIKYTVGSQSQTLSHASATTLPSLTKIGFAGYGQIQNFSGSGVKKTFSVTTTKTEDQLKEAGLVVKPGQSVAQALNDKGTNGLEQWQSLALGITSSTKPYVAPVQNNSDKTLSFSIGNYSANDNLSGVNVKFDVYELDTLDDDSPTKKTETSVAAGGTATVPVPSAVKYYKIKVTFDQP